MPIIDTTPHAPYLNPAPAVGNMDLYIVRSGILKALTFNTSRFSGRFLDVGAGDQPYRSMLEQVSAISEYVPLDLYDNRHYKNAEFTWDGITMPFDDNSFDSAMATEVLEHCPNPTRTLSEVRRVLKPGCVFFFTVPFLWPLHDCPYDEYRYTPWSLQRHLKEAGFVDINLSPTGGWDAALAQAIGLWVKRRPMSFRKRKWLARAVFPAFRYLIRKDKPASHFNHASYLMPGIAGTAHAT